MLDPAPRFSVVIATRGRPATLRETLASVAACDPPPAETIVVDGDEARSAEPVAREASARYAHSAPGLTRQRNAGLELARGYREPDVAGVTGRVHDRELRRFGNMRSRWRRVLPGGGREGSWTRFGYPRWVQDETRERDVEYMLGGLATARREVAAHVRFDELLTGYAYLEDEDFSRRLAGLGRIRFLPDAQVLHKNVGAGDKLGAGARDFNRTVVVNRAYLFRKNFRRTPLARAQFALLVGVLLVHRAVNGEWAGVRGLAEGAVEAWRRRP